VKKKYSDFVIRALKFEKNGTFSAMGKPNKNHGTKIDFDRITKASGRLAKEMVPLFKMGA
jgi:hypothetical protein